MVHTITTGASGTAVIEVSSTSAGTYSTAAKLGTTAITGSPKEYTFIAGVVSAASSTLTVTSGNKVAGTENHTLTATILDSSSNPISGAVVTFGPTANIDLGSGVGVAHDVNTGVNGTAVIVVSST